MSVSRASRPMISAQRSARASVASETDQHGISVAMVTFTSARTDRMAVTRSITQPISASASSSATATGCGHGASASRLARAGPPSAVTRHSSSVTNGANGCSSLRISSRTQAVIARVSSLAGPSAPCSTGLLSSTYQSRRCSRRSDRRQRRLVELVGLDRLGDLALRLGGLVRDPAVERLDRGRVEARHRHAMVHLGEAAAFQSLVAKLR